MVVTELDRITLNLHKLTIGNEQKISLKDIRGKNIPSFIKNFFDRESEKWIREESSMFLSSGRFNYDLPEVRQKFDELYKVLKETAIFSRAKLHRVFEQAVKLQSNFLIQPQRTMVQFIFRDEEVITPTEVMDTMNYFVAYDYYYKALEHYFQTNTMETISRSKFKNFIQQLDDKALSQDKTGAAVNVANVIVGFLNLGREQQSDLIDTEILISAYQDRNLPEYVDAMKKATEKGKEKVNVGSLDSMFKAFLETGDIEPKAKVSAAKVDVTFAEKKQVVKTDDLSNLVSQIEDIKEEAPEDVGIDALLGEEEDEDIVLPAQPVAAEVKPEPKAATPASAEAASAAHQLAEQLAKSIGQAESLEDLNKLIEDKDKKLYIKKVFKKKDKEFFQLMANLNATKTWKEASDQIEDAFYNLEVNPYQKEAIAFTDAVYLRYFPKKD